MANDDNRRWSAWLALVTAWLWPATTARRTADVSLVLAFVVHLAAGLLMMVAVDSMLTFAEPGHAWGDLFADIQSEFILNPAEMTLATVATVTVIEFGLIGIAWLLAGWGAVDEPLLSSYRHALRRVWLQCGQVIVVFVVVSAALIGLEQAREAWYVRFFEEIMLFTVAVTCGWTIWCLLRAVGIKRDPTAPERPPTCEACGYNLTMMALEGRCPECGTPVIESLGAENRAGSAWGHRKRIGRVRAWWQCLWQPILRPFRFGRQLSVRTQPTAHRGYLLINLLLIAGVVAAGVAGCICYWHHEDEYAAVGEWMHIVFYSIPVAALLSGLGALIVTLGSAGLAALRFRLGQRNNFLPAGFQAAAYLSGYLLLATVFVTAMTVVMALDEHNRLFVGLARLIRWDADMVASTVWIMASVSCLLIYLWLLSRATAATRYANR
jgi:hypothetical protein